MNLFKLNKKLTLARQRGSGFLHINKPTIKIYSHQRHINIKYYLKHRIPILHRQFFKILSQNTQRYRIRPSLFLHFLWSRFAHLLQDSWQWCSFFMFPNFFLPLVKQKMQLRIFMFFKNCKHFWCHIQFCIHFKTDDEKRFHRVIGIRFL